MRRMVSLCAIAVVAGCAVQDPAKQVKPLTIPKSTKVELVLAKHLSAGEAKEGDFVPFIVSRDVIVDGRVAIPKGALAEGKVSWSRSEGSLSGLVNEPARLEVKFDSLKLGAKSAQLVADLEDPAKAYAFTRENTGTPDSNDEKLDELLKTEANRRLAEKFDELFAGKSPDLSGTEAEEALRTIAGELGMTETQRIISNGKSNAGQIANTIERLQRGDISSIARGDLTLSLNAVMELANLVGGLGSRLSRALKGRTIHAYPGTVVEAYLAESVEIVSS